MMRELLQESAESLQKLGRDLVALEHEPTDRDLLLAIVDAIRRTLVALEASATEPDDEHEAEREAIALANTPPKDLPAAVVHAKASLPLDARANPLTTAAAEPITQNLPAAAVSAKASHHPSDALATPSSAAAAKPTSTARDITIRVDVGLLHRVMNLGDPTFFRQPTHEHDPPAVHVLPR